MLLAAGVTVPVAAQQPPTATTATATLAARAARAAATEQAVDARIEAVWPHEQDGEGPIALGRWVNVEVNLFERGTLDPVPCTFDLPVRLRAAKNWDIYGQGHGNGREAVADELVPVAPERILRTVAGKTFPVWVFNDVEITPWAGVPYTTNATTYFFVEAAGIEARSNVWGHGAPNTQFDATTLPLRTATSPPAAVESRIAAVWPHDADGRQQPLEQAPLVNIAVDLFRHPLCLAGDAALADPTPCNISVGTDFRQPVRLLQAVNNGYLTALPTPPQVTTLTNTLVQQPVTWPRWIFDNVDVSAARDGAATYYFTARVDGVETHTTIWVHGADGRTVFPDKDVPDRSGSGCA